MEICKADKCTGCFACVTACRHSCITMRENEYGELHPQIDESECKHCGLCQKICPNNTPPVFYYPEKCYASWITDWNERKKCASGGIGTALSKYVLKHGGIVFGTAYSPNFTPILTYIEKEEDIERLKGSKYAQSIIGEKTFEQVKHFLSSERLVLFIGTPCQIAGLKGYLQKDYQNLITVDLICHGVCPTSYFKEEIKYITHKRQIRQLNDIRFRGNDKFNYNLSIWQRTGSEEIPVYVCSRFEQPYFIGFRLGITLRENCYTCNYARPERIGDITIGDFLRLGKIKSFPHKVKHPSVVLINNEKGNSFYQHVTDELGDFIVNIVREYAERLVYRPSLMEPFPKHSKRDSFRKEYTEKGFTRAIRSILRCYIWHNIINNRIMSFKRIVKRTIKN